MSEPEALPTKARAFLQLSLVGWLLSFFVVQGGLILAALVIGRENISGSPSAILLRSILLSLVMGICWALWKYPAVSKWKR